MWPVEEGGVAAELLTMNREASVDGCLSVSDKSPDKTVPGQSRLASAVGRDGREVSGQCFSGVQLFTNWSQPKTTWAKCWPGVRAANMLSRSIEVTILKEAVLEREPLLLSLSPLLIVKVDVGALQGDVVKCLGRIPPMLTCSYSSLMIFGSSCLWNHIIYLVWNLQLCFLRALAARYCALVPSM